MIKNLVFDLGNVLIEWNPDKILGYYEPDEQRQQALKEAIFESGLWHQTDLGLLSLTEACDLAQRNLDSSFRLAVENIFFRWYEAVEVYHDLQKKVKLWSWLGYDIYILSTTCEIFYRIEKAGCLLVYTLLSGYILSSEVKVAKFEKKIPRRASRSRCCCWACRIATSSTASMRCCCGWKGWTGRASRSGSASAFPRPEPAWPEERLGMILIGKLAIN